MGDASESSWLLRPGGAVVAPKRLLFVTPVYNLHLCRANLLLYRFVPVNEGSPAGAYGLGEEAARSWGPNLSPAIKEREQDPFNESKSSILDEAGPLSWSSTPTMPFGQPSLSDLVAGVRYAQDHDYPARGHASGARPGGDWQAIRFLAARTWHVTERYAVLSQSCADPGGPSGEQLLLWRSRSCR